MPRIRNRGFAAGLLLVLVVPVGAACSVRSMAVNAAADALTATGDVFASDNDPELIRAATPFALKTIESLLAERPEHAGLLLAAARGFTQYAYAFVETDAMALEDEDPERARVERRRALNLYLRARDYGLRGLELRRRGAAEALRLTPESVVAEFGRRDVPLLYWTAAAWGAAISLGSEDPGLMADFPAVRALIARALELEPDHDEGALHEVMISLESVTALMGGSPERARQHFARAVELSGGLKAGPYVALASGVVVAEQDRREFERLLAAALAIDPDAAPHLRLANLITQRRAELLLARADHLFYADDDVAPEWEDLDR